MILAAGLTPAWQQIVLLDALHEGEVNRAREVHWCASGKVLNVGIALAHLGAESSTLSLVGGPTGQQIMREFFDAGYKARWLLTKTNTRVCTTILDAKTSRTTELVENSVALSAHDLNEFLWSYFEEANWAEIVILTGSLPLGTPSTYYRDLLEKSRCKAILDVRGPELLAALECKPFLVKPNREELAKTFDRPLSSDEDLLNAMRELNARGAKWVVVTQGKHPVWVTSATKFVRLQPAESHVVNPIGSGDSMAAGIAWGLSQGADVIEAVRLGMAAAADNLTQLLPARLNPDRVRRIARSISIVGG